MGSVTVHDPPDDIFWLSWLSGTHSMAAALQLGHNAGYLRFLAGVNAHPLACHKKCSELLCVLKYNFLRCLMIFLSPHGERNITLLSAYSPTSPPFKELPFWLSMSLGKGCDRDERKIKGVFLLWCPKIYALP